MKLLMRSACMIFFSRLWAADYFVSPHGSDQNSGSLEQPFATFARAADALKPGDTCYLREGVYREVLRPAKSGAPGATITFANYQNEKVVLSGADPIKNWQREADGTYSAPMPWSLDDGNQIFYHGKMLTEACWPNPGEQADFHPIRAVATEGSANTLVCQEIPGPSDAWKGAQLWCAGGAAWICWTSMVTAYDEKTHTLTFDKPRDTWYAPTRNSRFALRGVRAALDAPGEWLYDLQRQRLILMSPEPASGSEISIEAKRRMDVINLSDRSHIQIQGIHFRAGGIRMNRKSSHIVLKNLRGRHVAHSFQKDACPQSGILVHGKNHLLLNCDFGYSSSSVLFVTGDDHRIINCYIHHGGYAGLWRGTVSISGRRILFSHNTVRHSGRDLINTHGLMESLVQYNDVSDSGWLTKDLGMFYGHNTDFANTRFCYNLIHDNHAEHYAMGIYFDHLSHNAIVDHNVIWNVGNDPIRINNPSYGNLVFHNSCWKTGGITSFDHTKRQDLFACRYSNNIFNQPIALPPNAKLENNVISANPSFANPEKSDFRLKEYDMGYVGAYAPDQAPWIAGANLNHPPHPLPLYRAPAAPWMNAVKNSCFELGTLESWQKTHASHGILVKGNGWGNERGKINKHATGTSHHELQLGPRRDGVCQIIEGLSPNTNYTVSTWARVSNPNESIVLGVKNHGNTEQRASLSTEAWTRMSVIFKTGPQSHRATIYLLKASNGNGFAWCDNLTLPLTPK